MVRRFALGRKLLLACAALVVALLAAEGITRLVGVPSTPRPVLYTQSGLEVPLGEVIVYLANMGKNDPRYVKDDSRYNLRQEPPRGLLLADLKLRLGYTPPPRWAYFDEHGCVPVDTNSLGLRDEEFPVEKRPGELRILAIGDSMTYGMGVRLDLTWPQVLEAGLRAERDGPVEVINAGFAAGGNAPAEYALWVAEHGVLFAPDVVVIGLCLNDVDRRIGMLTYPRVELAPVLGGYSLLLDRLVQLVRQRRARSQQRDFAERITPDLPQWRATQGGLRTMRDTLAAADIPLVVAVFPMLSQLEPELYPCRGVHELVAEFCRREDIRCIDLLDVFLGRDEQELWVHPGDQHANDVGHALQAEAIHDFLAAEGLLAN